MILPRFELMEPVSVSEACDILGQNEKAKVIAGGTDLLVNLKRRVISADVLVSLAGIPELTQILTGPAALTLGPMVTIADVANSPLIKASFPVLCQAAGRLGSWQIRNRATIGGNVCTARPAGDTIGPLIAYGATAEVTGAHGKRTEPFGKLFQGPGKTTIHPGELLTGIALATPAAHTGGSYVKYTLRNAMEIALVSVTSLLTIEHGVCRSARVVLGAVAPTFVRCPATEAFLVGKQITEDVAEEAGRLVIDACRPITDLRASADYRNTLVQVLVKRSLLEAAASVTD